MAVRPRLCAIKSHKLTGAFNEMDNSPGDYRTVRKYWNAEILRKSNDNVDVDIAEKKATASAMQVAFNLDLV